MIKPEVFIREFSPDKIKEVIEKLQEISNHYPADQVVVLNIDTYGGEIYGLAAIYEFLQSYPHPIVTYTTSKAMSAGAVLLSSGDTGARFATPNATIMIHELSAGNIGDIKDLEDSHKFLKSENERWMGILARNMGFKNAKELRKLIKDNCEGHDFYLTAEQAKKFGIIDEICYLHISPMSMWNIIKEKRNRKELINANYAMVKGKK